MSTVLFWFRNDLRLHDQPALRAALTSGATHLLPVVCLPTPDESTPWGFARVGAHRRAFTAAREEAMSKATESLGAAVTQRTSAVKREWSEQGVGLTGEALTAALAKNPESTTLKAMKLLEAHPDLVTELQQQADLEALATGHLRTHLDLVEIDPKERTAKASALNNRLRQRALNAPLVEPLKKLVLRMAEEREALLKKVAAAEAEASKTRIQSEAGGVAGGGSGGDDAPTDDYLAALAKRLKIA